MRLRVFLICIVLALLTSACSPPMTSSSGDASKFDNLGIFARRQSNIFTRRYSTDSKQADYIFEQIINAIESDDASALKELFATSTVSYIGSFEEDIHLLMDFYEGEMISYKRFGPGTHTIKEGSFQRKEVFASFDVTTNVADYRFAIRFCTVDSENSGEIGVYSLYIIKAASSKLSSAYWGNDVWNEGINIEEYTN